MVKYIEVVIILFEFFVYVQFEFFLNLWAIILVNRHCQKAADELK